MCKSVKGAAYFGSSIHVVAGFVFFVWFLFDTVISEMGINLWKCIPPESDPGKQINILVHYLNLLFKFLYYIVLSVTGIYIFRGVERASPKIIKYALLVFVIVQLASLALFIAVSFTYYEDTPPSQSPELMGIPSQLIALPDDIKGSDKSSSNARGGGGFGKLRNWKVLNLGNNIGTVIEISDESEQLAIYDDEVIPVLESPLALMTTLSTTPMSSPLPKSSSEETLPLVVTTSAPIPTTTTTSTTTSTTTPPTTTPEPDKPPPEVPFIPISTGTPAASSTQKMSHNQLVSFVFQIFLVGFNAVGSFIYTSVLVFYLLTL